MFKKSVFAFSLLSIALSSNHALAFKLPTDFQDGIYVCKSLGDKTTDEIAKWVSVPIDYKNPQSEKTLIYTYTKKPLDPKKPTLIYFVGGPGSSTRGMEFSLPNFNVIFFEQRGISCSRPKTLELFLNPNFYSSENTANDAKLILDAYKVSKAAIYGHSYGTVPATIFASLFPERTKSLLLEGVVFKADESLWISPRKVKLMEDFFYSLPIDKQKRIIEFTNRPDVQKTWFSYIGRMTLGVGNFKDGLNGFLNSTIFGKDLSDTEVAKMFDSMLPKVDTKTPAENGGNYGEITMGMIGCQEMNMANPNLSHLLVFQNGRLVPDRNNIDRLSMCAPLGLADKQFQFYTAEKYPIKVPVTYFLGEYDPATSVDQGLSHFKNAQSQQKQALIMPEGGHTSNLDRVIEAGYCDKDKTGCDRYQQQIAGRYLFEKAATGQQINQKDLDLFNSKGTAKWIDSTQFH